MRYALTMNTFEQSEKQAAERVVSFAFDQVKGYVEHPGDVDAALQAVLVSSLEVVMKREITIESLR